MIFKPENKMMNISYHYALSESFFESALYTYSLLLSRIKYKNLDEVYLSNEPPLNQRDQCSIVCSTHLLSNSFENLLRSSILLDDKSSSFGHHLYDRAKCLSSKILREYDKSLKDGYSIVKSFLGGSLGIFTIYPGTLEKMKEFGSLISLSKSLDEIKKHRIRDDSHNVIEESVKDVRYKAEDINASHLVEYFSLIRIEASLIQMVFLLRTNLVLYTECLNKLSLSDIQYQSRTPLVSELIDSMRNPK
ncbi:MAG: hypothetical protein OXH16_03055 [Gemmatimonadetes bacterium]|nr:hypothetical protein [Gemmatimonadota bacterium]